MKKLTTLPNIAALISLIAVILITVKVYNGNFHLSEYEEGVEYKLTYDFDLHQKEDNKYFVKTYFPQNSNRQLIKLIQNNHEVEKFEEYPLGINKVGEWSGEEKTKDNIQCTFNVTLFQERFEIDEDLQFEDITAANTPYVEPGVFIESEDPEIITLAQDLKGNRLNANDILNALFNYVYEIPKQSLKELMTAKEALDINAASCNGKSRLFVALCRSLDIPARVVGGLILNDETKKTSHLWAEVLINGKWIPFDPLNGYFAFIPINYLEIYKGDEFLVMRSADLAFDYNYEIAKVQRSADFFEGFNLFYISEKLGISINVLSLLILLPFGALIVAIFRNVVGLKTFGVFLPVLMAISFISTGVITGIIAFVGVLLIISILHYPLQKWGVLHVPKLVVMLSGIVLLMIVLMYSGLEFGIAAMEGLTFFPIVILTFAAEKYARIVVEEGFGNATKVLIQTLVVTLICLLIISSDAIFLITMNFPEVLLIVGALSLMLGKWIGLRISEYRRFGWILN